MQNMWFAILCHKKITAQEHEAGFWMGILAPAQDDLTDNINVDYLRIKMLCENNNIEPENMTEFLVQHSAQKLFNCISNKPFFMDIVSQTQTAQQNSRLQFDKTIDRNRLKKIEFEKSSTSTILCRLLIMSELKKNEQQTIAQLGFLMQFLNDIFDVYKDREQQIFTIANTVNNIEILNTELDVLVENFIKNLYQLDYHKKQKYKFLTHFLIIASLGYVCLEQYKTLEINGKFILHSYNRKQLICDMEKPKNMFKSLKYAIKLMKKAGL